MPKLAFSRIALHDYATLRGVDYRDRAAVEASAAELRERAETAKLNRIQDNGFEVWRLRSLGVGGRYRLLVSTRPALGESLPTVIRVMPECATGKRT